jgi:hypothetical protein
MACLPSDTLEIIAALQESARRGDWDGATELAALFLQQDLPASREELSEYLRLLKAALIVAKTSRAHAAASLVRFNAAAEFNNTRAGLAPPRQEFGEAADF